MPPLWYVLWYAVMWHVYVLARIDSSACSHGDTSTSGAALQGNDQPEVRQHVHLTNTQRDTALVCAVELPDLLTGQSTPVYTAAIPDAEWSVIVSQVDHAMSRLGAASSSSV